MGFFYVNDDDDPHQQHPPRRERAPLKQRRPKLKPRAGKSLRRDDQPASPAVTVFFRNLQRWHRDGKRQWERRGWQNLASYLATGRNVQKFK
jgi:hypothetical protein